MAVFFFLYSMLHFYVFVKARSALGLSPAVSVIVVLFMLLMIIAPVAMHLAESAGRELLARAVAYTAYVWMAFLFLLFCALVVTDLYRLALYLITGGTPAWLVFSLRSYFLLAFACAVAVAGYGSFEAKAVRVETVTIANPKIPAGFSPLRIVQISDVHLGLTLGVTRLKEIMRLVKAARPDILVSTGDFVDGRVDDEKGAAALLREATAPYGKFAITGNHEFYSGLEPALAFTQSAGFRVLRGEAVNVGDAINVVGVDDPAGFGFSSSPTGEKEILSSVSNGRFTLLLKHRPLVEPESAPLFDLQLSGHVHGGQIFPFRLITRCFFSCIAGLYRFPPCAALYVNRGSGTWGPPIRVLAPPEVTVINLVRPD